jgi:hypothetical protein
MNTTNMNLNEEMVPTFPRHDRHINVHNLPQGGELYPTKVILVDDHNNMWKQAIV